MFFQALKAILFFGDRFFDFLFSFAVMNADSGFDAQVLREQCNEKQIEANIDINERNSKEQPSDKYVYFDELLYKKRFVIERMNAWIDSFKALLIRFETLTSTWMALHFLAFAVILCRKITNC